VVHHCRNSCILSVLSALLTLFRCACVSSFSILVQSGSKKSCIMCIGRCLVTLIICKQLSFHCLAFWCTYITNLDSLMFMVATFTYITFGLEPPGPHPQRGGTLELIPGARNPRGNCHQSFGQPSPERWDFAERQQDE
jgi:hypothetical protein